MVARLLHKKSPFDPSKLSWRDPIYGSRTMVAVEPIAAKARIPLTIFFCLLLICRSLTTNMGRMPSDQSAITFNPETAYVRPITTVGLMQCFWVGSRLHQSETG